ncbi:type III-B CRISPR module-associated Cmr3 family protein [Candidatus Protofrankia californiensis]|uniref:type III-B CRISPR module-associated Cmr3 family protein n=1 Tax=Candidatus Protofrankia californiensis TaxID=1839754 RepID=UPI0010416081|nr:type III-B CRISPR module-associated Cmr3 family protein [Candidatus Protofrankia californiensis]
MSITVPESPAAHAEERGETDGEASAWVLFHPLDVVTFRDGRPFTTGMTATAHTTLPRPTSTGGALRTVFGSNPLRITGPVLVRTGGPRARVLLPAPADLVVDDRVPRRLRLHEHPGEDAGADLFLPAGVESDLDFRAAEPGGLGFLTGAGEPSGAYLSSEALTGYLDGDPSRALEHLEASAAGTSAAGTSSAGGRRQEPLVRESRLGIARHARSSRDGAGRTTLPGFLYQADFWRPSETGDGNATGSAGVAFGCRVWFRSAVPEPVVTVVRLGGEARQAAVTVVSGGAGLPALPKAPERFPDGRVLLYLATPAVFRDGWLPELPDGARLRGACTLGPEVITGIDGDSQRGRPLRWAVAAGSVYFLEFDDPAEAEVFARKAHGECLPQMQDRTGPKNWMRTVGFGLCLVGRW